MKKLNYTQFIAAMLETSTAKLDKYDMQVAYTFYNNSMSVPAIAELFDIKNS
tara:strand:+ start:336 stop:491 length:156 start_codon:yes stop_codon:yes gene_type:complete